jgi:hypothetical protein
MRKLHSDCEHVEPEDPCCAPAFKNFYECPCGVSWEDKWSCACNDRCPSCNKEIEPSRSKEVAKCACEYL